MAFFEPRTSLHGRRLALSSTGGIIQGITSTGRTSTDFDMAAVMRDSTGARLSPLYEPITTHSSTSTTLVTGQVNLVSSATSGALTFTLPAPVAGIHAEVIIHATSTTITLQTSATTILFYDSTLTRTGATGLAFETLSTDGGNYGAAAMFRGLSTTKWQVMHKPRGSTATL